MTAYSIVIDTLTSAVLAGPELGFNREPGAGRRGCDRQRERGRKSEGEPGTR